VSVAAQEQALTGVTHLLRHDSHAYVAGYGMVQYLLQLEDRHTVHQSLIY